MNSYYHQVSLSFNYWYILLVVSMLASVILGLYQFRLRRSGRIERVLPNSVFGVLSGVSTALFVVMFVKESTLGLIQFLDNGLAKNESPALTIFVLPFAVLMIAFVYAFVIWYVGRFAGCAKLAYLKDKRKSNRRRH